MAARAEWSEKGEGHNSGKEEPGTFSPSGGRGERSRRRTTCTSEVGGEGSEGGRERNSHRDCLGSVGPEGSPHLSWYGKVMDGFRC